MRKIYLIALFALVSLCNGFAQKLQITNGEEVLSEGETVVFPAMKNPFLGRFECNASAIGVKNLSSESISCTTTYYHESGDMTYSGMQACQGGSCSNFDYFPYTKSYSVNAGEKSSLKYEFTPTKYGELTVRVVVNGGAESHTVYLKFVYSDPTGIDDIKSASTKSYNVYDMNGRCLSSNVENLNSLTKGLYIVRDNSNGNMQKIILR